MTRNETLAAATEYAGMGFPVFPCRTNRKEPAVPGGFKSATTDRRRIEGWWKARPDRNIGLHTRGLIVLDVDPEAGDWLAEEGKRRSIDELRPPIARTPRGGRHIFFKCPAGVSVKTCAGQVARGVDVRGDDGYVVVAPSQVGGRKYEWIRPLRPRAELPEPPDWLLKLLPRKGEARPRHPAEVGPQDGRILLEGRRNGELTSIAGKLRHNGLSGPEIEAALLEANRQRCRPPLPEAEVKRIAASIARYPPGPATTRAAKAGQHAGVHSEPPHTWQPFPTRCLPEPISGFVKAVARSVGCDPSMAALPALAMLGRCIGNRRVIRLKPDWTEPAVIWAVVLAPSGSMKSPVQRLVFAPLSLRQAQAHHEHQQALVEYERDRVQYERDLADWKRGKLSGEPPAKPEPPVCEKLIVGDITIEALADRLGKQPDPILVRRDEFAGWLDGLAEYKGGRGSDLGHWLSLWQAQELSIERKTGQWTSLYVPRAAACLFGTCPPEVFIGAMARRHLRDGLCARFLLAHPPDRLVQWSEATIRDSVKLAIEQVVDGLLALEGDFDADGRPCPRPMDLDAEGNKVWVQSYDEHRQQMQDLGPELRSAAAKLEAYAARFALIFHLVRMVAGDPTADPQRINAESVRAGVELARWFLGEAIRLYRSFGDSDADREARELFEWVVSRQRPVTVRDLTHGLRRFRGKRDEAEAALDDLVKRGWGRWEVRKPGPQGGQPARVFEPNSGCHRHRNLEKHGKNGSCGDGDAPESVENAPADPEPPEADTIPAVAPWEADDRLEQANRLLLETAELEGDRWIEL